MSHDGFYRAFEDRHRGSREAIQERQRAYLPFVLPLVSMDPTGPVTDLGCGRGEWIELLRSEGVAADGVDLDESMLAACRERGLQVQQGDAIGFLRSLPEASRWAITAFHLVEHLPFDVLHELVVEALRVLRPGGLLIMETPNPENLVVGSSGFYMDPTHERPLPPLLLAFVPEYHGYARVKTLRLQEAAVVRSGAPLTLIQVLAGVSPDYAVIAQKEWPARPTGESTADALAALDHAFLQERGYNLNDLADRHEQQWLTRVHEARALAHSVRNESRRAQERSAAMEQRMLDELLRTRTELREQLATQLQAVYNSRSWRITRPLRWASSQAQALRQQGAVERARRFARKGARFGLRMGLRAADRFPLLRRWGGGALRALGLHDVLARLRARAMPAPALPDPGVLSAPAQRVETALAHALAVRRRSPHTKEN